MKKKKKVLLGFLVIFLIIILIGLKFNPGLNMIKTDKNNICIHDKYDVESHVYSSEFLYKKIDVFGYYNNTCFDHNDCDHKTFKMEVFVDFYLEPTVQKTDFIGINFDRNLSLNYIQIEGKYYPNISLTINGTKRFYQNGEIKEEINLSKVIKPEEITTIEKNTGVAVEFNWTNAKEYFKNEKTDNLYDESEILIDSIELDGEFITKYEVSVVKFLGWYSHCEYGQIKKEEANVFKEMTISNENFVVYNDDSIKYKTEGLTLLFKDFKK